MLMYIHTYILAKNIQRNILPLFDKLISRQITDLSNDSLTQLLLYGDQDLSNELNRNILELTLRFIHETSRFQ